MNLHPGHSYVNTLTKFVRRILKPKPPAAVPPCAEEQWCRANILNLPGVCK